MPERYPLFVSLQDRVAVLVGGGRVAVRKARGLIDAGALEVRVVSPVISDDMPAGVVRVLERYQSKHLDNADLVFAVTDSQDVNAQVVRDARERKLWVNRADTDDDADGNFIVPAQTRFGAVHLAISAGSAGLSRFLKEKIAASWNPDWTRMADAMRILRPRIRDRAALDPSTRREILQALATDEAIAILASGGTDAVLQWLQQSHPELADA